jgi:hypothetical protein
MAKAIYLFLLICGYFSVAFAIPPNAYERTRDLAIRASPPLQVTTPSFAISDAVQDSVPKSRRGFIRPLRETAE